MATSKTICNIIKFTPRTKKLLVFHVGIEQIKVIIEENFFTTD